jgi:hypothetical protein
MTVSHHASIVDDNLLVSSTMIMSHPRGDAASMNGPDKSAHISACENRTRPASLPLSFLNSKQVPSTDFRRCEGACGSCPFCLTDYRIDISWQGAKKGYLIKLVVYRQLGDCRSPSEWSWRSRLALRTDEKHRIEFSPDYGPGFFRGRWNKAEGVMCSSPGEWVNVPEMKAGVPASS